MNMTKTPYILLCDENFILDLSCDIEKSLILLKTKNLDISGGYFKNITSVNFSDFLKTTELDCYV